MNFWQSLSGMIRFKITTVSGANLVNRITNEGINLMDLTIEDFSIHAIVLRKNFLRLKKIAEGSGDNIEIIDKIGVYWSFLKLKRRKLLMISIIFIFLLTVFIPTRIFFVKIEGNTSIPSNYIIHIAQSSGITFGASRREVRSEKIKNMLLEKIPELQWAGINTYGCVAVISVKERSDTDFFEKEGLISNIIATHDGVIEQCTVIRGNPLCKVGQSVKKGQVLISGYVDCGRYLKSVKAEGEIVARTLRENNYVAPTQSIVRKELKQSKTNYSLIFGKNLIKLSQDSGISSSGCVKMYTTKYITLPGGFCLPIGIVIEQVQDYAFCEEINDEVNDFQWMRDCSEKYLLDHIIAGQIVSSDINLNVNSGCIILQGNYVCLEMIGQVRYEEIIHYNGKTY